MSKAAFWQRGETIDYKNTTTSAIEANTVMAFGKRVAVAGMTIAPRETGSLHVTGIYRFEKAEGEIAEGAEVYLSAEGKISTTASDVKAGFAVEAATAADTSVLVKINA